MKLTRDKRIALELLGPPALGAAICLLAFGGVAAWEVIDKNKDIGRTLKELAGVVPFVLVFAYMLAGIQSILYTVLMEWRIKRGLDPKSWQMVRWSSLLGFGAGAILAVIKITVLKEMGLLMLTMGGLGLVVGFLMGLLIKHGSTKKKATGENPA